MSNSKEVRELQFTRMQLVVVFILVVALGAFIFVLGVSVGKKQARLSQGEEPAGRVSTEVLRPKVKARQPVSTAKIPADSKSGDISAAEQSKKTSPSDIQKELASFKAAEKPSGKIPAGESIKPKSQSGVKSTATRKAAPAKTSTVQKPSGPAAKTTVSQSPPANLYYIQVAAATQKAEAVKLADRVRGMGFNAYVLDPLSSDRVAYFRVRVGGYKTEAERTAAAAKLALALDKKVAELYFPPLEKK